ncbi:MAG TPA: hypothetical protein VID74_01145 [Gemmatimonadales bacterium]|jgi:hypothetical protein
MSQQRIAIIGAGLCGSVLAARLRDRFEVIVVEQSRKKRPLYGEITCDEGGINSSINRAAGLGGTTNYWHNALIELAPDELLGAGIDPLRFADCYRRAWSLFLSEPDRVSCDAIRDANARALPPGRVAHMVVPRTRVNVWNHAQRAYPGNPIAVVYGRAERLVCGSDGAPEHVLVQTGDGPVQLRADRYILSAGGLATPGLLARSLGIGDAHLGGYHDHPMAYVAKLRLRADSTLREISCRDTTAGSIRSGFVYEAAGLKAVFYLRPALTLDLKSITGEARYLLSDLRNAPFSPRKIGQLLTNIEALREALLFKTRAGFRGDYYSVLMLGEQGAIASRGIEVSDGGIPALNWQVTAAERAAYQRAFAQFLDEMTGQIADSNVIAADQWEYRTAAHHSGAARDLLAPSDRSDLGYFAVAGLPAVSVCDASLLRRGGIANSGLTLVALCHQLADALAAQTT